VCAYEILVSTKKNTLLLLDGTVFLCKGKKIFFFFFTLLCFFKKYPCFDLYINFMHCIILTAADVVVFGASLGNGSFSC